MKKGWNDGRLSSFVTEFIVPQRDKPKKFDGNIPWCRIEDFNGVYLSDTKSNQYVSKETIIEMGLKVYPVNTVIVSCSADLGRCAIIERPLITNQTFIGLVPGQDLDPKFLYYFMGSVARMLNEMATGATIKYLSKKKFQDLNCCFPPLNEQQKIVAILDKCFEALDKAKSNAERNLKNAKELFESYVDGVFDNKREGWEERRIDEICKLINGRAYKKDELLVKGKYRVLRVGNFFTSNHWYFSDLDLDEDKYCDKGDLLYAWSASFGPRIWKEEKVIYHYHIWKVIPNESLVSKEFLFTLFEWDKEKIKAAQGTGATMMHVSKGSMENRIIPLPPLKEQQIIVRQLAFLRSEIQKLEVLYQKKIDELEGLKKSILQKAFNGELKIKNIDI